MGSVVQNPGIVERAPASRAELSEMPRSWQDTVFVMHHHGEASVQTLSAVLHRSEAEVDANLRALITRGLVARRAVPCTGTRRQRLYRLTPRGQVLVLTDHAGLCRRLLRLLQQPRPVTAVALEDALTPPLLSQEGNVPSTMTLSERFDEAASAFNKAGFFSHAFSEVASGAPGTRALEIYRCPVLDLARQHPAICRAALKSLSEAFPDASVRRIRCMVDGGKSCTYVLRERLSPASDPSEK